MNKNIFREYDIRGIYPKDLNEDIYFEIGNAIASKCNQLNIAVHYLRIQVDEEE